MLNNFLQHKEAYSGHHQSEDRENFGPAKTAYSQSLHYNSVRSLPLSIKLDGAIHSL